LSLGLVKSPEGGAPTPSVSSVEEINDWGKSTFVDRVMLFLLSAVRSLAFQLQSCILCSDAIVKRKMRFVREGCLYQYSCAARV
jgi:hypothetical protein